MRLRGWTTLAEIAPNLDWGSLDLYVGELERWNRAIRLVGPKDFGGIRTQVEDALLPFVLHPVRFPLLDIGSGAGLPGIPLAILCAEAVQAAEAPGLVCLEPLGKRVSFLRHAVRQLGLKGVEVLGERAEDAPGGHPNLVAHFLTVTARAVTGAHEILPLAAPYLAPGGQVFLPRGDELPADASGWRLLENRAYKGPPGVGPRHLQVYERER